MPASFVGINTQVPNRLVSKSIKAGRVPELNGCDHLAQEVKISSSSRLDIMLSRGNTDRCYIEIKNCTLVEEGVALFPDPVTRRGRKHLIELQELAASGFRCVLFDFGAQLIYIHDSPSHMLENRK